MPVHLLYIPIKGREGTKSNVPFMRDSPLELLGVTLESTKRDVIDVAQLHQLIDFT